MYKLLLIPLFALFLSGCSNSGSYSNPEADYSLDLQERIDSESSEEYLRTDDPSTTRSFDETGDMDCSDFTSQDDAQEFFDDQGGPDDDFHNLDRDGDGTACDSLP